MRQKHLSPTHRRLGYQIWCDEAQGPASSLNAVSILYVIAHAHKAVKKVTFGNTPRQRKMRTKHTNRYKTHLDIEPHAFHIGASRTGNQNDSAVDANTYASWSTGRP